MASAEMARQTLGLWIKIENYTNSKAFLSQSRLSRCENNFFQSLLPTDLYASAGMCAQNFVSLGSLFGASVKSHRLGVNTAFLLHPAQKQ